MGLMSSIAMAEQVKEGLTTLYDALKWHLQCNFFRPYSNNVVGLVQGVFRRFANETFEDIAEETVLLPKGTERKIAEVVEDLKLWPFVPGIEYSLEEPRPEMLN